MTREDLQIAVQSAIELIIQDGHEFYRYESAIQYLISVKLRNEFLMIDPNMKIYTEARFQSQKIDIYCQINDNNIAIEVKNYYLGRPMANDQARATLMDIVKVRDFINHETISQAFAIAVIFDGGFQNMRNNNQNQDDCRLHFVNRVGNQHIVVNRPLLGLVLDTNITWEAYNNVDYYIKEY